MIIEYIKIAYRSIVSNKARSLLTTLGVIIGVASVVLLTSLGSSARSEAEKQVRSLGSNVIFSIVIDPNGYVPTTWLEELQDVARIQAFSPIVDGSSVYEIDGENYQVAVQGVNETYGYISSLTYRYGSFFKAIDVENNLPVVVIGSEVAQRLFGLDDPVGKMLTISGMQFQVVGVITPRGTSFAGNQDAQVYIPYGIANALFEPSGIQKQFYISSRSEADVEVTTQILKTYLSTKLPSSETFSVFSQTQVLDVLGSVLGLLTTLLAGIAAISLLVGGIGIMNIMLVTVRERTREIGVRKALGARRSSILLQFLIEAILITLLGGAMGLLVSIVGAFAITQLSGFQVVIGWNAAIFTFLFSMSVGIIFGLYPAYKASNLEPVEALRYE
ncbi:MAG: ABC transporter permease [Erysipelotrichaceae bacterium]